MPSVEPSLYVTVPRAWAEPPGAAWLGVTARETAFTVGAAAFVKETETVC